MLCAAALVGNMLAAALPASADTTDSMSNTATFTFTDSGISVSGSADDSTYSIEGTALTIKKGGSYKVTGSCSDGSVKVKKGISGVTLTLSDLDLTSETTAPVTCNKNSQAEIVIEGTVTLEDNVKNSEDYWYDQGYTDSDTELDSAENAVIKLKGASKVIISGDGTLNIKANAKNGIKSGSTLDSDLETEVAPDSTSDYYAFLTMKGITANIDTTSVYTPESTSTTTTDPFGGNPFGQEEDTYGDAINAECCLTVESGTYNINAGDDGIKSDYYLNIGAAGADDSELDININESYEGLEGAVINIYSGDIDIYSSDDAINAANGDLRNYNFALNIYGGDIYADASQGSDNDGLDSNGTISIFGGRTVSLSDSGGNSVDLESTLIIDGGFLLGIGAAPMDGGTPSAQSKQNWAVWSGSGSFNPGGPGGGGRPTRPGENNPFGGNTTGSTNIASENQSRVTLTSGNTTGIAIGSAPNVTAGSNVAVMLDGTTELISTTARVNASYVIFAGDLDDSVKTAVLTYVVNGSSTDMTATVGNTIILSECLDTPEGSEFKEWNTNEDGTGTAYAPGDSFKLSSNAKLYAIFESTTVNEGYKGTFVIEGGQGTITTYDTQDYTKGNENVTEAYARDSATGEITTDGSAQINFKVNVPTGYEIDNITVDGKYKNLKTPDDTKAENTYRITRVESDLTITVTLKTSEQTSEPDTDSTKPESDTDTTTPVLTPDLPEPTPDSDTPEPNTDTPEPETDTPEPDTDSEPEQTKQFKGTFVIEGGQGTVTTYDTQDYTKGNENVSEAYARDSATGEITGDGNGQINFKVNVAEGYEIDKITVDGTYKNLKTPEDTGAENTYRITKIESDLTITVTLKESALNPDDIPDIEPEPDEIVETLFGDTTQDGSIFSDDALLALRHSLNLIELKGLEKAVGDVNQDGIVDSADALLILRCSVGLTDEGSLAGVKKSISLKTFELK